MAISFPPSPSLNQVYTFGGRSWLWNGYAWQVYPSSFTSGLTVGASTITGGAAGQIVYDSGGIFNEATGITTNGTATLNIGTQGTTQGSLVLGNTATTFSTTIQSSNSSTSAWTLTLPVAPPAANGYLLSSTTGGVTSWIAAPAAGITINTTTITGGTSGRILYDNAGTVGELVTGTGVATAIGNNTNSANGLAVLNGSGILAIGQGGTGTSTTFTQGSVIFAGASGVYSQDNANFFWDDTNNILLLGTNTSSGTNNLQVASDALIHGLTVGFGKNSIAGNTACGVSALSSITTGGANTGIGTNAGAAITSAVFNTAVGGNALQSCQTGDANTAVGVSALSAEVTGIGNVAIGQGSCTSQNGQNYNTGLGCLTLTAASTGSNNTAVGYKALQLSTSANNTAVGYYALNGTTSGTPNTAVGYLSLEHLSTGANNVGIGDNAANLITTTGNNTVVGSGAMAASTTGASNVAIGSASLAAGTSGNNNVAIGYNTLNATTGNANIAIGYSAGSAITSGANNVIIGGYTGSAAPISATASGYIVLSDGSGTIRQTIDNSGNVGIATTTPGAKLDVNGTTYLRGNTTLYSASKLLFNDATNTANQWGFFNSSGAYTMSYGGTEYNRMDTSGNLILGSNASTTAQGQLTVNYNNAGALGPQLTLVNTGGAIGDQMALNFYSSTFAKAQILCVVENNPFYGQIQFNTGSGSFTNRMILTGAGYLLIGYASSNGAYNLQVNSQIFATNATIATSDARYKENVQPLEGALNIINLLNPVSFDWKPHPVHNFDTENTDLGFLAQELQEALAETPYVNNLVKSNECELPDGTKEEFLGIAEGSLIPLLTKAIQELSAQVDELKAQVAALSGK